MRLVDYSQRLPRKIALNIRQAGAGLIEVLIAIVIMSFGVLALSGMQAYAVAANQNVLAQGVAASMAADFAEMMRANPAGFGNGKYDAAVSFDGATDVTAVADSAKCTYPNCTAEDIAKYEVAVIKNRLRAGLRAGTFALVRPTPSGGSQSTTQADLWIMWTEKRNSGSDSSETNFDKCPSSVTSSTTKPRCFYMRVSL